MDSDVPAQIRDAVTERAGQLLPAFEDFAAAVRAAAAGFFAALGTATAPLPGPEEERRGL